LVLISDWLKLGSQVHFLFYEEVKADPVGQVRSLLTFLNFPVDEQRLDCLAGGRRETFHRLVGREEVVKPFEERPALGGKVDKVVREAERLLREAGWRLPVHLYPEFSKQ